MFSSDSASAADTINWIAVGALYAGLLLGLIGLVYWGEYRNAFWLLLIGTGGACTAYARVLDGRGEPGRVRCWKRAGAVFYGVFFLWAGTVLFQAL